MSAPIEYQLGAFLISDDPARLDSAAIHAYLTTSYWCEGIPLEIVQRSLAGSLCVGAYDPNNRQVGLVRVISDFATFAYLCDVYVLEEHRRHGLAKAMLTFAVGHPRLQGLRRWNLVTRDAHPLYAQYGFTAIKHPDRYMERLFRNIYRPAAEPSDNST